METQTKPELDQSLRYIRFGPFQIDQHRQQVSRNGARLKLQGKVYQVLAVLLLKQGQVVTREELKQSLWPADTHVNFDANVNTTVNKLRQILGDSTDKPAFIETIPRKGYSFIGTAEFSAQPFPISLEIDNESETPAGEDLEEPETAKGKTDRWMTLAVIMLVLAGMLLGAGIATIWIAHFAPRGPFSLH